MSNGERANRRDIMTPITRIPTAKSTAARGALKAAGLKVRVSKLGAGWSLLVTPKSGLFTADQQVIASQALQPLGFFDGDEAITLEALDLGCCDSFLFCLRA